MQKKVLRDKLLLKVIETQHSMAKPAIPVEEPIKRTAPDFPDPLPRTPSEPTITPPVIPASPRVPVPASK